MKFCSITVPNFRIFEQLYTSAALDESVKFCFVKIGGVEILASQSVSDDCGAVSLAGE